MVNSIIQAIVLILFPAAALYGATKHRFLEWLSPVVLCYGFGIALANIPGLPINIELSQTMTEAAVLLAIPMLLFCTDFFRWIRLAGKTILSFFLGVIAVIISASTAGLIFKAVEPEYYKIAGMLIGVYTGGTGNMTAIGKALGVSDELFILVNVADMAITAVYLFFLLSFAQKFLLLFLPAFKKTEGADDVLEDEDRFIDLPLPKIVKWVAAALLMSAVTAVLAVGISKLLTGGLDIAVIIVSLTTIALAASFYRPIREAPGAYDVGNYLLLVFCCAIGTLANLEKLASAMGPIMYITLIAVAGAVALHFLFAAIFRIDADTVIITSTAAVFSPAFVGPVAAALKNREIVVSGVTTGVIGFAIGNYVGLAIAYILARF